MSAGVNVAELPLWQCHKQVRAVKIFRVLLSPSVVDPAGEFAALLCYETQRGTGRCLYVTVNEAYMKRHQPQDGGYYVRYEDGYESYSPAEAFEGGYRLLHDGVLYTWCFVTETGKRFEVLSDKPIPPSEAKIIDTHEIESFDWAALQRLRKAGA